MTRHILVVDDEAVQAHALATVLRREYDGEDVQVDVFTDPLAALVHARQLQYAVVISDYRMPSIDGIEFLKGLRELSPETVRLMLTASADLETAMTAINDAEVFRFIRKPWQAEICDAVRSALDRYDQSAGEPAPTAW